MVRKKVVKAHIRKSSARKTKSSKSEASKRNPSFSEYGMPPGLGEGTAQWITKRILPGAQFKLGKTMWKVAEGVGPGQKFLRAESATTSREFDRHLLASKMQRETNKKYPAYAPKGYAKGTPLTRW